MSGVQRHFVSAYIDHNIFDFDVVSNVEMNLLSVFFPKFDVTDCSLSCMTISWRCLLSPQIAV